MDPNAEEFVPGLPYGYCPPAPRVLSFTDEILYGKKSNESYTNLRPDTEEFTPGLPYGFGQPAPVINITDEALRVQGGD